jgi:hypothetical protein
MDKITKVTGEKFIRTTNDAQVAQFGHLNAVIDVLNQLNGQVNVQSRPPDGGGPSVTGGIKILTGTITYDQLQLSTTYPVILYTITAEKSFIPIGGLLKYTPTTFIPTGQLLVYYTTALTGLTPSNLDASLAIDAGAVWNNVPSSNPNYIQFLPGSAGLSTTPTFKVGDSLVMTFEGNFSTNFITPVNYTIFGIELSS